MKIHWPTGSLTFPPVTCSHPDSDLRLQSQSLLRVQQLFLKLKVPLTHAHPDSFAKRCKTETTTTRLSLAAGPDAKGLWYFLHLFKPLSPVSLPGCPQSYLGADQWSFNPLVEKVGSHRFVCLLATHINSDLRRYGGTSVTERWGGGALWQQLVRAWKCREDDGGPHEDFPPEGSEGGPEDGVEFL